MLVVVMFPPRLPSILYDFDDIFLRAAHEIKSLGILAGREAVRNQPVDGHFPN